MYMRWHATKRLTEENIEKVEFAQYVVAELDKIFNQNTGIVLKDLKSCKGGIVHHEETIWFSPEDLEDCFNRGFVEYYNDSWWEGPQNPLGFRSILLLAVHEYAHTLFFKWGYHKRGIKSHARQFRDICRHLYRQLNFQVLYDSWQESKEIDL